MRVRPGPWGIPAVAFVGAFLVATAWTQETERTVQDAGRRKELAGLVASRQRKVASLERELSGLRDRLRTLASARSPLSSLEQDLERFGLYAGTTRVRGPGLTVVLSDSPLSARGASTDFVIQDVDLQLVVNELWLAGAEAVAINGQRIVGTTAIRSAGEAILVNFKVLTSPYRIEAVGPSAGMRARFRASEVARRFGRWVDIYRLGFEVRAASSLTLPAYRGSLRFRYAEPA